MAYTARSDSDGIYELRHLDPATYTVESRVSENQYASSRTVTVGEGLCTDGPILLRDYSLRGRLLPGLVATVELVGVDAPSNRVRSDSLEPDGRFYFRNVPTGEYVLSVTAWVEGTGRNLYYPGTYDRQKAA